jgi:glycogen debranching enzyme
MSTNELPRLSPEVVPPRADRSVDLPVSGETEPLVLARGNLFCVTNHRGDIAPAGALDLGLFHEDTRHLSYFEMLIAGGPPIVLSADIAGAATSQIDLTLTDSHFGGFLNDPQNFLHIRRKHLLDGALVEQFVLTNHLRRPIDLWLELRLAADFADVFEVRGARRTRRGTLMPPQYAGDQLVFRYHGLDRQQYRTCVRMTPEPARLGPTGPFYQLTLLPGEATVLELVIEPSRGDGPFTPVVAFDQRCANVRERHHSFVGVATAVHCNNSTFDETLRHDLEDLDALRITVGGHTLLAAGIPWFAAAFGRDSILSAYSLLSIAPELAVETLHALAHYQGQRDDDYTEEEPGKIMHELRLGELARVGEIPHAPYYGSIDATPLWLMLFGETRRWLGDRPFVDELMPHAERALDWVERRLDAGGGFVRYQRKHEKGLENQGWKDSRDAVSFPDGTVARAPIALVEVQGYVVAALDAMAELYRARGLARAGALASRAIELRRRLHDAFWVPESRYYALALDADDRCVTTIASNAGHLLFSRAVDDAVAARLIEVLFSDEMYSGYGVRTVARGQTVFNPLSYHNGSVWPHDNALIALGASLYGHNDAAERVLEGLYGAARHFRRQRLPELFCGLGRAEGDFLVHYPVSCSPQAWASAALFLILQACLGLRPDATRRTLVIRNPRLPRFVDKLDLDGLLVGDTRVSLHFARHDHRTHADVLASTGGPLRVQIEIG